MVYPTRMVDATGHDGDQSGDQSLIAEHLDSQLADMRKQDEYLRRELEHRTQEIRRRDTIIAQLTQRIPAPRGSSRRRTAGTRRETAGRRGSRNRGRTPARRGRPAYGRTAPALAA